MRKPILLATILAMGGLIAVGGLALAGNGCPASMDAAKTSPGCPVMGTMLALKAPVKPGNKLVVLTVTNLTDEAARDKVTKSLTAINGVDEVAVSLKDGAVEVSYDPAKVKPDQFAPAVVKAGYTATLVVMDDKAMMTKAAEAGSKKDACCGTASKTCAPGH
ncbi:MAG: heavy-metal-associated domain-containing protein [candidate division Zixibacteria bacterium]|nr:heavy-metal-associated domain-containing protein [candidate division Zixibacteria bacterium]